MDLQLKDKVVLVSGGAKGIGAAICKTLAREGAIPIVIGRKIEDNKKLESEIIADGGKCSSLQAELSNPAECEKVIELAASLYGRIDGVVNNAGANDGVGLENGNYDDFMKSLHNNLVHYYLVTKYALPFLKASKGAIVNIGSKTGETGQGGTSAYAAANGGRNALTREWAIELLPYSIRVNSVIVAEAMTPLYQTWLNSFDNPQEKLAGITKKIPFENRMTKVEEIADTVAFLLSAKSGHTTGQLIHVDGGYVHLDRAL